MRRFSLPELRRLSGGLTPGGSTPALAPLPTIPTLQELRPVFDAELRRSRRYERPLVLLVVVPDLAEPPATTGNGVHRNGTNGAHHDHDGNGTHPGRTANGTDSRSLDNGTLTTAAARPLYLAQLRFLTLGSLLCGTLRESDVIAYAAELHEFVALLPECGGASARQAIERLDRMYVKRMGIGLRAGIAVYPTDGLTLDDLLSHARQALQAAPIRRDNVNNNGNGGAHA